MYLDGEFFSFAAKDLPSTDYALACIPNSYTSSFYHGCNIRIFSTHRANVTISSHESTTNVQIQPGVQHVMNFDESMWPDAGVEKKGIIITSNEEISIVSESLDPVQDYYQDTYQVRLQSNSTQEYFAISVPVEMSCATYNHYLSVVTYEDDTDVLLIYNDGSDAAYNVEMFSHLRQMTKIMTLCLELILVHQSRFQFNLEVYVLHIRLMVIMFLVQQ